MTTFAPFSLVKVKFAPVFCNNVCAMKIPNPKFSPSAARVEIYGSPIAESTDGVDDYACNQSVPQFCSCKESPGHMTPEICTSRWNAPTLWVSASLVAERASFWCASLCATCCPCGLQSILHERTRRCDVATCPYDIPRVHLHATPNVFQNGTPI